MKLADDITMTSLLRGGIVMDSLFGDIDKPVLSVSEMSKKLGIGRNTCYAMIKSGEIQTVRAGRRILVPVSSIQRWLLGETVSKRNDDN